MGGGSGGSTRFFLRYREAEAARIASLPERLFPEILDFDHMAKLQGGDEWHEFQIENEAAGWSDSFADYQIALNATRYEFTLFRLLKFARMKADG